MASNLVPFISTVRYLDCPLYLVTLKCCHHVAVLENICSGTWQCLPNLCQVQGNLLTRCRVRPFSL